MLYSLGNGAGSFLEVNFSMLSRQSITITYSRVSFPPTTTTSLPFSNHSFAHSLLNTYTQQTMEQSRNANNRPIGGSKQAAPLQQQSEGYRKALRQQLAACKFYLDGVDTNTEKQIRNRFQLLGLVSIPFVYVCVWT